MACLKGKHVIVGITGSIAAYKSAELVRLLVKAEAEVRVVMTALAKEFITPLTMSTLSKNPISVEFFNPENGEWNSHVSLGEWADLLLIAPVTANTMAKMAMGVADNLLLTTYLSAKCPVMIAPAMDLDMYKHPATMNNLQTLRGYGVKVVEPETGELASGLVGKGRMAEPSHIFDAVCSMLCMKEVALIGKKVVVSAGPTYEKIDPVRFIGNYSSGKMGYAIAQEFSDRGAEVVLVSGPVSISVKSSTIKIEKCESADDMFKAMIKECADADVVVSCAAVADFTPITVADSKIKRHDDSLHIELKPTQDIAAELGRLKHEGQVLVGFALETNDELVNAESKLEKKNLDLIVLNSLKDNNACFGYDTNKVTLICKGGDVEHFPLKSKVEVASDIVDKVINLLCR